MYKRQPWKEWTKHDKKVVLRKLIQYAKYGRCDHETPIPPEVSWIKLAVKENDTRVTPENLLTPKEFEAIVKAAENTRDRALIYVLFEAALRPGELLGMNVGSVQFRDSYCLITVTGKTGLKRIPLVVSYNPLLDWLKEHPARDNPHAPLWCSTATNYKGERLSYRHFRLIIRRLAKKAGINKSVWPYLFRHSCLTALAKVFTEARLELYAGWVHGSKMARRYVHFSARDLEDAVLELHGLREGRKTEDMLKVSGCPRCGERNTPDATRCSFCGYILDKRLAIKVEEEERRREEAILERIERLERLVYAMIGGQETSLQQASSKP